MVCTVRMGDDIVCIKRALVSTSTNCSVHLRRLVLKKQLSGSIKGRYRFTAINLQTSEQKSTRVLRPLKKWLVATQVWFNLIVTTEFRLTWHRRTLGLFSLNSSEIFYISMSF